MLGDGYYEEPQALTGSGTLFLATKIDAGYTRRLKW